MKGRVILAIAASLVTVPASMHLDGVPRAAGAQTSREGTWTDQGASFSASGQQLVYMHEDACDPRRPDGIYVMRSDGTRQRLLLRTPCVGSASHPPQVKARLFERFEPLDTGPPLERVVHQA